MEGLLIRGLTIQYSSAGYVVRPIAGLDLDVAPGEVALLLGASGSGKTTLLSALAGILTPKSGQISFNGVQVTGLRGPALASYRRQTVGIVFQAFNLIPSLSATENVQAPLWAAGVGGAAARQRAARLLEEVDLTDRATHRPADLSGGQQQRVAIARALANDPPLVLADEPTAHLDYIQVEGVLRLLRELAGPGRVVVVATHDERLLPLADQVVELTPRHTPKDGPPQRVELASGHRLFEQGDAGELIYIVESGAMELLRARDDGTEEIIGTIGPGEYFGELAPTLGLPRSAAARAQGPTVVMGYSVRDFKAHQAHAGNQ
jgi:putative ABC transport system ATP-binding protein